MTASDCQEETQESEGTLGKKRDAPTILSVPPLSVQDASCFCPKEPLTDLFQPLSLQRPSWDSQLSHPGGSTPQGAWVQETNTHPFLFQEPPAATQASTGQWECQTTALYPRWGMGVLSTPGLGQSPRSLFPPLSSGQAWEKPGSSNIAGGQKQAQIRVHFYNIPSGCKEMPDPGCLSTLHPIPHPHPPSPPSHQARPGLMCPDQEELCSSRSPLQQSWQDCSEYCVLSKCVIPLIGLGQASKWPPLKG